MLCANPYDLASYWWDCENADCLKLKQLFLPTEKHLIRFQTKSSHKSNWHLQFNLNVHWLRKEKLNASTISMLVFLSVSFNQSMPVIKAQHLSLSQEYSCVCMWKEAHARGPWSEFVNRSNAVLFPFYFLSSFHWFAVVVLVLLAKFKCSRSILWSEPGLNRKVQHKLFSTLNSEVSHSL